ncbi:MAG: SDR family oxidoreductase [Thermomicrobium sp.]|nr:SDR family oxidoreductase [Thermomicrobium sp.]
MADERWLDGLVALVTSAGRGELGGGGAGIARALASHGAQVVVNDVTEELVAATVGQIQQRGGIAWGIAGDVSAPQDAQRMVDATVEHFGRIDILVNNAALGGLVPAVEHLPDEVWQRQVAIDLSGPFFMSRAALRHMVPRRFGRIVNIGSLAGVRTGFVSGAPYTTAKSGLIGLTRQMALEFAPTGSPSTCSCPPESATRRSCDGARIFSRDETIRSDRSIPKVSLASWSRSSAGGIPDSSPEQRSR